MKIEDRPAVKTAEYYEPCAAEGRLHGDGLLGDFSVCAVFQKT